jgi:hypothetical protein
MYNYARYNRKRKCHLKSLRILGLHLIYLLLDTTTGEREFGMLALQLLDLTLQVVIVVNAVLKVPQQHGVAQEATFLSESRVVQAQRVLRLLDLVQRISLLQQQKRSSISVKKTRFIWFFVKKPGPRF